MNIAVFLSLFIFGMWIAYMIVVRIRPMSDVPSYIGDSVHFALGMFASSREFAVTVLITSLYVVYQIFDSLENDNPISKDLATYLAGLAAGYGFTAWNL